MEKAFQEILKKLKEVQFACIGTTNMSLQGIDIQPKDIDFVSDDEGVEKIAQTFGSQIDESRGFKETEFKIVNWEVHVASMTTNPLRNDDFKNLIWVEKWGLKIPCMPLKSDLKFYQRANRAKDRDKIKLIKEKIKFVV